jgi:hypothetical protein
VARLIEIVAAASKRVFGDCFFGVRIHMGRLCQTRRIEPKLVAKSRSLGHGPKHASAR